MANAYTSSTGNLAGTAGAAGLVQKAYDRLLDFALRSEPLIRSVADKRPTKLANPGSTVVLQLYADLSEQTTALTESTERDSVQIAAPTSVTITLAEYGNSVLVTRALELFSLADVDPAIANIIAFNLADSIDSVAMTALRQGSNVIYSGSTATSTATITAAATLSSANIRKAVAKLRANKANGRKGSLYWAGVHPEVSHDLRAETGSAGWLLPNQYGSAQDRIWAGEIGTYEGAYFVESARLYNATDGASSARNYRTIIAGQQALAVIEALASMSNEPNAVTVPVAVILAEASASEPPVADTVAVPSIAPLPNVVLVANADTSANPFITALPNTNVPLVSTVTVAVALMLAADVLKRMPDALTVASAVMAAEAVTILPLTGKVLKGAWEKAEMPNIYYSLKCYFFPVSNGLIPFI